MEEKIMQILVDLCGDDEILEDRGIDLFDAGLLDSLGTIELLLEIESQLGVVIQPTEIVREHILTPNKIIETVSKRL
ncbi:D-alanine--poly(phosphoribitol) ligase subunit DltC [Hathewaya limosa]|uniref:D-alanyl carrier protein n=1 Tax=Hathewaya limosa TaxID=1536 RepID=A0ABU0JSB6_HATLI|nr:D-alanine--poly(phosphoribitol) ligase subunit DltC [Hathewaya limosa]MDQ0479991.1 D-alanine--poly(phosphoribitol) ligase subunit 2 [Hathewaya limosa]